MVVDSGRFLGQSCTKGVRRSSRKNPVMGDVMKQRPWKVQHAAGDGGDAHALGRRRSVVLTLREGGPNKRGGRSH